MKFNQRINWIIADSLSLVMASSMMSAFPAFAEETKSADFLYDDYSVSYNVWSNIEEDFSTQSKYAINIEESVAIGFGAFDKVVAYTKNGLNYNIEVYKYLNFDPDKYSYIPNIYKNINENETYKLLY